MTTITPPTPARLVTGNMVAIPNLAVVVDENGHPLRVWNGTNFIVAPPDTPYTTQLYAVPNWWVNASQVEEDPDLYLGGSALGGHEI